MSEKNGKALIRKRTRNTKIQYFFMKDRVDAWEVIIDHYPTEKMWGERFTKALLQSKFRRFRLTTLGQSRVDSPINIKECVGPQCIYGN